MKQLSAILLVLALSAVTTFAQRPKVGVVLCGGGAKGAAHVGALKVLEEHDIPIDYIVGSSMGAIIAGLYAIGYSAGELDSLIMVQDWNLVMNDRIPRNARYFERKKEQDKFLIRIPFGSGDYSRLGAREFRRPDDMPFLSNIPLAMVSGQNIYNLFTKLSVGYQDSLDFNKMPIPFACVAVDLIGKKEVVFHSGNLVDAIRASMAIPGYFSPVRIDNMVLVDGGLLNNYPVDVAKEMGADIIIGVKLNEVDKKDPSVENIADLANEMIDLYMDTKFADAIANTDILITPGTKGYGLLSFDTASLRTLIDNGEAAAREKEEELLRMKDWLERSQDMFTGPLKQPERYRKAVRLDRDSITIGNVSFDGLTAKDASLLLGKSCLKPGARVSGDMIEKDIAHFYNTAAFESVTYLLKGSQEPYRLELNFVPGRKSVVGLGFRFDNEEIAALLVNLGINENALYGSKFSATAKLAYNYQAKFKYTYAFRSLAKFNTSYSIRSSDLNIMNQDYRSNLDFSQHAVIADFSTEKARNISIDVGARLDFFSYNTLLGEAENLPTYNTDLIRNKFFSVFGRFQIDGRDHSYFPTRGFIFDGSFRYFIESPFGDYNNFSVSQLHLSSVIPAGKRLAFILSFDNRTILGTQVPLIYGNFMGGYLPGRYLDQQIPFPGFESPHVFRNILSSATLDTRLRFLDNHYLFLSGACAMDFQALSEALDSKPVTGAAIGYSYNSFFGPLGINIYWSDFTRRTGVYISLGHTF